MRVQEFQNLSPEELTAQIEALEQKYFNVRESVQAGKEKNYGQLRSIKKDIARAQTILREKMSESALA